MKEFTIKTKKFEINVRQEKHSLQNKTLAKLENKTFSDLEKRLKKLKITDFTFSDGGEILKLYGEEGKGELWLYEARINLLFTKEIMFTGYHKDGDMHLKVRIRILYKKEQKNEQPEQK